MTKISLYNIDDNITANDKWIGSDVDTQNRTKNFTPKKLANYFNENQVINIGTSIQYKYYTLDPLESRPVGTLTFETEIGATVPFSTVNTFLLSKYTTKQNDVSQFLPLLVGTRSLLYKSSDINSFGLYTIDSIEPYITDPNFWVVTLTYMTGNGSLEEDKDYMISLVDFSDGDIPTKTSDLINDGEDGVHPFITLEDIPPSPVPTLQLVTDEGNITTNSMTVDSLDYFSTIDTSSVGTQNKKSGAYAYLGSEGVLGLNNSNFESNLKNTYVTHNAITLEFPDKVSGIYTIATTEDIGPTPTLDAVLTEGNVSTQDAYLGRVHLFNTHLLSGYSSIGGEKDRVNFYNTASTPLGYFGLNTIMLKYGAYEGIIHSDYLTASRDYYLPNQSGTIALLSDIPSLTGYALESWVTSNFYPLSSNPAGYLTSSSLSGVVLTTTDQTITGTKSFNSTTLPGVRSNNNGAGKGFYSDNLSNGIGYYVVNTGPFGVGFRAESVTGSIGNLYEGSYNAITNFEVSYLGEITAVKFTKAGGTSSEYLMADGTVSTGPSLTGFVPYTGATSDVDLGLFDITASHLIKDGGVSTQFLKADGSVDNNIYLTSADLPSTLDLFATTYASDIPGYSVLVRNITDSRFNTIAVDVSTGVITTTAQLVGSLISDANTISGNPGIFNITTIGNISRTSGTGQAEFFFRVYKRDNLGIETFITESSKTLPVTNGGYVEFSAAALWNDGVFLNTDRIVLKYYADRLTSPVGSNPTYKFQFGGISPVRSTAAVPVAVLPNIYLSDLADVEDIPALNNEILYWNDTASLWEHSSVIGLLSPASSTVNGYLTSTDWTIFNTKQNALTNPITGTGTTNYLPKFTGTSALGNSSIQDIGSLVTITNPTKFIGLNTIQGTIESDSPPLSSELTTTATGTNWTGTGFATGYTHTIGSIINLTSTLPASNGTYYQIIYTITGRTTGSITINYGGISIGGITANGINYAISTSTAVLSVIPTTDFNGTLILSIKTIGNSSAITTFLNSSGVVSNEIRASNIITNYFSGINAGAKNINGYNNYISGQRVGNGIVNGINNTLAGSLVLNNQIGSNYNTAIGSNILSSNNIQNNYLTAVGGNIGSINLSGVSNTFIGWNIAISATSARNNSAVGYGSLGSITSGFQNSTIDGLSNLTSGNNNTSIGSASLSGNTTGSNNIAIGRVAGFYISNKSTIATIVNDSVFLGFQTSPLGNSQTNQIVIGYDATGLGSNTVVLGNNLIVTTALRGNVGIGTTAPTSKLHVVGLVDYATNALAIAGGLTVGAFYHTSGVVKVVI